MNTAMNYKLLTDHQDVCLTCQEGLKAHDAKFPDCQDRACEHTKLCIRGDVLRVAYLDAADAPDPV